MKRIAILTILFALLPFAAQAADPLAAMLWKNRILILFDKSRSSAILDRQVDLLRQRRPDVKERDLIVLVNAATRETAIAMGYTNVPRGSNRALRRRFEPSSHQMTAILIGKDGEEKARWTNLVQPDEIFEKIDQIPMRQREIEESAATN